MALLFLLSGSGCTAGAPPEKETPRASARAELCLSSAAGTKHAAVHTLEHRKKLTKDFSSLDFPELAKKYHLVSVPTYDGSGQATHPKILYFPDGWNGWKYWMSFTPYPGGAAAYENPSVVVSNDLIHWKEPGKEENPISGIPADSVYGGHYSDSHIVMHGRLMELWYRYNRGNRKTVRPDYSMDFYYRRTSSDGIHWSSPELMHRSPDGILSLVVNYSGSEYEFWYTNYRHQLLHAVSKDGSNWSVPDICVLSLPKNYAPWHQDIIQYNRQYYLLQTGINLSDYSFSLFLSHSSDGVHFSNGIPFYPSDDPLILSHRAWLYRSTLTAGKNGFDLMISMRFPDGRWYLMKSELFASAFYQNWKSAILLRPGGSQSLFL